MTLDILQQKLSEVFGNDSMIKGFDSVFESTKNGKILVISIHELTLEQEVVIHTKFTFPVDEDESKTRANYFRYLYDINCLYKQIYFDNENDLVIKIKDILDNNKFGDDIKILSDFIEAPGMFINDYLKKNNVTDISIFDIMYNPKFKITPCYETKFDFSIKLNNEIGIEMSIFKSEKDKYIVSFKIDNNIETFDIKSLLNIHQFIGGKIIELLQK